MIALKNIFRYRFGIRRFRTDYCNLVLSFDKQPDFDKQSQSSSHALTQAIKKTLGHSIIITVYLLQHLIITFQQSHSVNFSNAKNK